MTLAEKPTEKIDPLTLELERLVGGVHSNPHAVLGRHPTPKGVLYRAYRPGAHAITWIPNKGAKRPMLPRPSPLGDVFELEVSARDDAPSYRYEVEYEKDQRFELEDPYRFPPTMSENDVYLFGEGTQERVWKHFGAHERVLDGVRGTGFAVWAPTAAGVSVVGDFDSWDGRLHMMRRLGDSGIWEIFVPDIVRGAIYKYEIHTSSGARFLKTDPVAASMQRPPATASVVFESEYNFGDSEWVSARSKEDPLKRPLSIYELHLGSWKRDPAHPDEPLSYRVLAPQLADYAEQMGYTHIELMPPMEHPFTGSWGYQVSGYFTPTARYGTPDDFRFLVDHLHQRGIGVLVDWVPAHFPRDAFALGRFDGSALYEHLDPRQGEHPDWGTYVFNYGRKEVRSFLLGSAFAWFEEFHVDGLRVDAVASMLYLDYSRKAGEWIPNVYGGRENLEVVSFLKELNTRVYERYPGVLMVAEESTAWPGVSRPTYAGGLGFGFKWNMGWMHDTLQYFELDPIYRRFHAHMLTFATVYAYSENFVLPLSHDEVVHGKGSLLQKMPGDRWQKMANLRALFAFMWSHAGKKLLFMGQDFAQDREWSHDRSLDWHLLAEADHAGMHRLVADLNRIYRATPALWEADHDPRGMRWIDASNADQNVYVLLRRAPSTGDELVCVFNLSPVPRLAYRIGLPQAGAWTELLNTDSTIYAGSNVGNYGGVVSEPIPCHGFLQSAQLSLPPLAVIWLQKKR